MAKSFTQKVLDYIEKIPRGKVATYKSIANDLGMAAYRAVGTIMARNQDPVRYPCYKVVKSNGEVGKYSATGGNQKKIEKLWADGIEVINRRINLEKYLYKR